MDFSREESLIVVKISEAIQQGRLNAAAEHVTARSVALASHTHTPLDHGVRAGLAGRAGGSTGTRSVAA